MSRLSANLAMVLGPLHRWYVEEPDISGWEDIVVSLSSGKTAGASVPTWSTYRDGISAYAFGASGSDEIWCTVHVLHDYAEGTTMYPHVHWSPNTTSTGVVRWGMEYTVQKGHQQGAFPSTTTIYIEDTIAADSQYMHRIAEVSDADCIPATNLETDALILFRIFRDGSHANDTFPDAVFGFQVDLHYRKNKFATVGKRPNFNVADD